MPRYSRIPAVLRTNIVHRKGDYHREGPKLWNAKRRIRVSQPLPHSDRFKLAKVPKGQILEQVKKNPSWMEKVSPDVKRFIEINSSDDPDHLALRDDKLLPEDIRLLLSNPALFFSRPWRVPVQQRKQVYLYCSPNVTQRSVLTLYLTVLNSL
jgi:hypothetical protein